MRRGIRIDPLGPSGQLVFASAQYLVGRTEEAAAIAERERAANPDEIRLRLLLAYLYAGQDRLAEARTPVAEVRAINPELTAEQATRVTPSGQREEVIENLRRAGLP